MFFRKFALAAMLLAGVWAGAEEASLPVVWQKEFSAAQKLAVEKKRPLVMLFTGSDWCPYCVLLEKRVLGTKAFRSAVRDRAVLLYLDFPRRQALPEAQQKQNGELAQKYGVEGFPTTVVLGTDGKVKGRIVGAPPDYLARLTVLLGK